jgi:hypothetical protein
MVNSVTTRLLRRSNPGNLNTFDDVVLKNIKEVKLSHA